MQRSYQFLAAAVVLALLLTSACQSPPARRPGPLFLKSVHPPTGQCGHHTAAPDPSN